MPPCPLLRFFCYMHLSRAILYVGLAPFGFKKLHTAPLLCLPRSVLFWVCSKTLNFCYLRYALLSGSQVTRGLGGSYVMSNDCLLGMLLLTV